MQLPAKMGLGWRSGADGIAPAADTPIGPAGGDLTGNYPNPTIDNGAVTSAKIGLGAVTAARIAAGTIIPPTLRLARSTAA